MNRHFVAVSAVVTLALPLLFAGWQAGAEQDVAIEPPSSGAPTWSEVLQRSARQSDRMSYRAGMIIVNLSAGGPHLTEVQLARAPGGNLQLGRAESWLVGRDANQSFFVDEAAGHLLDLGQVEQLKVGLGDVSRKYDVELVGEAELDSGRSYVLVFRTAGDERAHERLFVHRDTGLVVRRETYSNGAPVRVVTLTDLQIDPAPAITPPMEEASEFGPRENLSADGIETLSAAGWDVPQELPGGFSLAGSYAVTASESGAVHLVYSDGLYLLSVYEQPGHMAADAIDGATPFGHRGMYVYRWPGSEPERMVWSGAGRTFTAVTDAPPETALTALAALPADPPDRFRDRLGRGFVRIGRWIWPFD